VPQSRTWEPLQLRSRIVLPLFILLLCAAALSVSAEPSTNRAKASAPRAHAQPKTPRAPSPSNEALATDYFRAETAVLAGRCLADVHSLQDWEAKRGEYRRQLQEMLGLWPAPERTPLHAVVTGKLEQEDFVVEKLHFQALPRLYVTANLYLPKHLERPAPGVLYVCGHSRVVTNGVSCGNKTAYQHHGAWFARNGYVCLLIDTLQYGEIQGAHRGTHLEGQWWWNARGYTPAGVEAWFGIRALDYLCSRPEVDSQRLGMTGRSGGGAYTWTVAALDDRVRVAAPVAGITDLQNHVLDGAVDGHCDCMFYVNTYRWDFPQMAALLAPRPLLLGNSDKDTIFPLDGVLRVYEKTRTIYSLYGARTNLGLLITEGPHADTQDLQVPVFRWFNRFLKHEQPLIEMAARKFFAPEQLRVFDQLPADEINSHIQEQFVTSAKPFAWSADPAQRRQEETRCVAALRQQVFAGWPTEPPGAGATPQFQPLPAHGLRRRLCTLQPQPGLQLPLYVLQADTNSRPQRILLILQEAESGAHRTADNLWLGDKVTELSPSLRAELEQGKTALAFFAPRGVEPAPGASDAKTAARVRRRYMLLGQTLDSMRVWDIRCAVRALAALPDCSGAPLGVRASGTMGVNAAYAALFEPRLQSLELSGLPSSHQQGPDYLNVLRVWDIPQLLQLLGDRAHVTTQAGAVSH
jgi:dienelactone hydrolase